MSLAALQLLTYVLGVVSADDTLLVQTRVTDSNATATASSGPEMLTSGLKNPLTYRFLFTKTWGADHHCLTEISFLDAFKKPLIAKYKSLSSCYGCAISCDECEENYGNPHAQFDGISDSDAFEAWSCTDVGSYPNAAGQQELQFTMEDRPTMVIMHYPHTDGLWQLRDFVMQVKPPGGGEWVTIATMVDAPKNVEQFFFVQAYGSLEKPMVWPINYDLCGEYAETPIIVKPDRQGFAPTLTAKFAALADRQLADISSENSMTYAVDGNFGNITIKNPRMHQAGDGTPYTIKQFTVNFPATHVFWPAGAMAANPADLEVHFILQKVGSFGVFDLAVVTLLLDLPKETADQVPSMTFWREIGLETLPMPESPKKIPMAVDLSVFSQQFAGGVSTLKCAPDVDWYLLHESAFTTGSILHAMKVGPIPPEVDECDLLLGKEGAEPKAGASLEPAKELSDAEKLELEQKRKDCEKDRATRKQIQLELEQAENAKGAPPS